MAQLDFFLNLEERNKFLEFCFESGSFIIPDINYHEKEYIKIDSISMVNHSKPCNQYFIANAEFYKYPLEYSSFNKNEKTLFYIKQRYGGPTILFSSSLGEIDNNNTIGPGSLSIYPFYYVGLEKIYPPVELITLYSNYAKYIKKQCIRVKLIKRTFWIGKETIEMAQKGEIKLVDISGIDMLEEALKQFKL